MGSPWIKQIVPNNNLNLNTKQKKHKEEQKENKKVTSLISLDEVSEEVMKEKNEKGLC